MYGIGKILLLSRTATRRQLQTLSGDGPTENLKRRIGQLKKGSKKNNTRKDNLFVEVPESQAWLDTPTMPMILTVVGTALFVKLLMVLDDYTEQERIERRIKKAPPGQGTVRMLTREEWEKVREVRPRTPFESKHARAKARIRTGEPIHMEDFKDWTIDVLTDAFTRAEESVKQNS